MWYTGGIKYAYILAPQGLYKNTSFHDVFPIVTVVRFGRICSMLGSISVTIYGENCSSLSFGNGFVKKSLIFHRSLICRMKNCDFWMRSRYQKNLVSMLFDRLALIVSVANPSAIVLFTRIDVAC
jgi:hypothetical protein